MERNEGDAWGRTACWRNLHLPETRKSFYPFPVVAAVSLVDGVARRTCPKGGSILCEQQREHITPPSPNRPQSRGSPQSSRWTAPSTMLSYIDLQGWGTIMGAKTLFSADAAWCEDIHLLHVYVMKLLYRPCVTQKENGYWCSLEGEFSL